MKRVRVSGKAILTGEHAVLRGVQAIVLPVKQKYLEVTYAPSENPLKIKTCGSLGQEAEVVTWGVIEKAIEICGKTRADLKGEVHLVNNISVGVGLGASAALCVGVGRLMEELGYVKAEDLFEYCRNLENIFHGESSGVDIAVALSGEPILYQREEGAKPFSMGWSPKMSISYCGQRGITSECVAQVKELIQKDSKKGSLIDQRMQKASELAILALQKDEAEGFFDLVESIQMARECFDNWDLTRGKLEDHVEELLRMGAIAVKPTGSGGGGHALALWKNFPKNNSITPV